VVKVYNNLGTESTGIHFHGLDQRGTQFMDGPSGVTQCPIPPGSHFTYTFQVSEFRRLPNSELKFPHQIDEPGSYWYHSHNKGQYPDGLRGMNSRNDEKCMNIDIARSYCYPRSSGSLCRAIRRGTGSHNLRLVP
jgi:FtsP/CotA-like multicopper oxidase with cupredoxin domain